MTVNKSARYALYAALEMALGGEQAVTVSGVAARYGIPATALAKVLQQLVRSGLAVGTRGVGGGYRLAKPASKVTVLDLVSLFDPPRSPGACLVVEPGDHDCGERAALRDSRPVRRGGRAGALHVRVGHHRDARQADPQATPRRRHPSNRAAVVMRQ